MVRLKKPSLGNKILYEVAIGIVAVILLLGVLNTVTHTSKVQIVSNDDLANSTVVVYYALYNASTNELEQAGIVKTYNMRDIATEYNGFWYISIPYDVQYKDTQYIALDDLYIELNTTYGDLIDRGFNNVELYFGIINDTELEYNRNIELSLSNGLEDAMVLYTGTLGDIIKSNTSDVLVINKDIDLGHLLVTTLTNNYLDKKVDIKFGIYMCVPSTMIQGSKLKLNLYTTSNKPLLKAFSEPAYGIIAGLWSTLVALYNRVRQYALSFFGGFSVSALFTGLIGDPTTALIISAAAIAIFFFAITRPAPRRH